MFVEDGNLQTPSVEYNGTPYRKPNLNALYERTPSAT